MMFNVKLEQIAHHTLYLPYPGITKLNHLTAINADNMIMLSVAVGFFELRHVFSELMPGHKIAGQQKLKGIVYGCTAHPIFFIFHVDIK